LSDIVNNTLQSVYIGISIYLICNCIRK